MEGMSLIKTGSYDTDFRRYDQYYIWTLTEVGFDTSGLYWVMVQLW